LDVQRLNRQTYTIAEFLQKNAPSFRIPKLVEDALVHGHCHHKAVMGFDCEQALFQQLGLRFKVLDSGCCGMAGSFGFEHNKYDVSVRCGERVLLPTVREAAKKTLIIADGFSCREQISQQTTRKALHTAEVLQLALHAKPTAEGIAKKEREELRAGRGTKRRLMLGGAIAAAGAVGVIAAALLRKADKRRFL
jgi:Fe-S oxidoreductase